MDHHPAFNRSEPHRVKVDEVAAGSSTNRSLSRTTPFRSGRSARRTGASGAVTAQPSTAHRRGGGHRIVFGIEKVEERAANASRSMDLVQAR
jgi:hypothetical protein